MKLGSLVTIYKYATIHHKVNSSRSPFPYPSLDCDPAPFKDATRIM